MALEKLRAEFAGAPAPHSDRAPPAAHNAEVLGPMRAQSRTSISISLLQQRVT
jgi:hypothetical protein